MFTRHEIFKHIVQPDSDSDVSDSDEDLHFNDDEDDDEMSSRRSRKNNISITLHLVDRSFVPNSSSLTRLEPINSEPIERIIPNVSIGAGSQTFRWLALMARGRLHQLYHREGLVRQREAVLGRQGSFLPTSITSEDPETDREFLEPDTVLNTVVQNGDHLWLNFDQAGKSSVTSWERRAFFRNKEHYAEKVEDTKNGVQPTFKARPVLRGSNTSVFLSRKYEADSHDFYDSVALLDRAFQSDWSRWKSKPRFFKKMDSEVKRTAFKHYAQLRAVFRFFASSGAGEPFTMSMNEFVTMTRECQIPEHSLGVLWSVSNFNPEDPKTTDHVLERYEFLEILLRLASEIYIDRTNGQIPTREDILEENEETEMKEEVNNVSTTAEENKASDEEESKIENETDAFEEKQDLEEPTEKTKNKKMSMSEAVNCLMNEHINQNCWTSVKHAEVMYADPDAFRRERLYFEEVNSEFLKYADDLFVLYETYAQRSALRLREFNSALKLLCFQEFQDVLQASGVVSSKDEDVNVIGDSISVLDVRRSFVFAQMTCAHTINRSRRERSHDAHNRATFVEFCEAIARLCDLGASKKTVGSELLPALSTGLGPFLKSIIDGHGSEFWKSRRNKGHYDRTVTKKFGKRNKRAAHGPEVGRFELDRSKEAVTHRQKMRKNAAVQLPSCLGFNLPIDNIVEVEEEDEPGSKKK